MVNVDYDRAATLIRGAARMKEVTQAELARCVGLNRIFVNAFLTRRINLLPADVQRILAALGIEDAFAKLATGKGMPAKR